MKDYISSSLIAALGLASTASALVSFSPIDSGPTYKVGIPSGSSISDSTAAPIYFSLSAPTEYRWVGLGIGDQMAGATIFVMYADGNGNVTISGRSGQGHVQPLLDTQLMTGVTLLAGSGINGDTMTANVRCTTCTLSSSDLSSSPFISAWQTGSALNSDSLSATILQHNIDAYRQFSFDLSQASIASDTNPFVTAASPSSSGTASGTKGSTPASTGSGTSSTSTGESSSDGNSGVVESGGVTSASTIIMYQKAHGIIMGVVMVLLFPLGAVIMRLVGSWLIHGLLQMLALCLLVAGLVLGIKLANMRDYLFKHAGRTHTIFGVVIFALFWIQPFLGLAHHKFYKKHQARHAVSHTHIWFGRIIIILGVINGGLGLQLADNTKGGEIAYGVVAGVVAVSYAAITVLKRKNTETKWSGREKVNSREGSS